MACITKAVVCMRKILFVCLGNICRSPMAEFVMKKLVAEAGLENAFFIASAATSDEERGNPVYPPARRELASHGISCAGKTARQITAADYNAFDVIVAMERANLRALSRILPGEDKTSLLLDYTDTPGDIADPWYTGDFAATYRQVLSGCRGLLAHLTAGYSH